MILSLKENALDISFSFELFQLILNNFVSIFATAFLARTYMAFTLLFSKSARIRNIVFKSKSVQNEPHVVSCWLFPNNLSHNFFIIVSKEKYSPFQQHKV